MTTNAPERLSYDQNLLCMQLNSIFLEYEKKMDYNCISSVVNSNGATSEWSRTDKVPFRKMSIPRTEDMSDVLPILGITTTDTPIKSNTCVLTDTKRFCTVGYKKLDWKQSRFANGKKTKSFLNLTKRPRPTEFGVCKLQEVPKSLDNKRMITVEPTENNLYQKAIQVWFDRFFRRFRDFGVDLHCQSVNGRNALMGSRMGYKHIRNRHHDDYGTIDLKHASDSLSKVVVEAILNHTTIGDLCIRTRCDQVILPDGTRRSIRKYAGMGNTTTFPVECLIFSLVCILAKRQTNDHRYHGVVGDDITIAGKETFDLVCEYLELLGFTINLKKTYPPCFPFKEACGVEAYYGHDVTPIKIGRRYDTIYYYPHSYEIEPETILQYKDMMNDLTEYGYVLLSKYIAIDLKQHGYSVLTHCEPSSFREIITTFKTDRYCDYSQYNKNWQVLTFKDTTITTKSNRYLYGKYKPGDLENYAYEAWLCMRSGNHQDTLQNTETLPLVKRLDIMYPVSNCFDVREYLFGGNVRACTYLVH